MRELDNFYLSALNAGLGHLRAAADSENLEWLYREAEHLHNMPSLVSEPNVQRHIYYRAAEAISYIEWLRSSGAETQTRCGTSYLPLWNEFDSLLPVKKMNELKLLEAGPKSVEPPTCHYLGLLSTGLISVRAAANLKDLEWAKAEIDHLRRVMPLLNETEPKLHRAYLAEKESHAAWLNKRRGDHSMTFMYRHFWDSLEVFFQADNQH